jgi:hypothetical protein
VRRRRIDCAIESLRRNAVRAALGRDLQASLKKFNVPQREIDELLAIVETTREQIVEVKDQARPGRGNAP